MYFWELRSTADAAAQEMEAEKAKKTMHFLIKKLSFLLLV